MGRTIAWLVGAVLVLCVPGPASPQGHGVRQPRIERRAPAAAAHWPCHGGGGRDGSCSDAVNTYVSLAHRLAPEVDYDGCRADLRLRLAAAARARNAGEEPEWLPSGPDLLPAAIPEHLGLPPWLDALEGAAPQVRVVRERTTRSGTRRLLFLDHPDLGAIPAILALPRHAELQPELPVVLGLPGHGSNATRFLDTYGTALLERGIAVLALSFRAYGADGDETLATTTLLCAGSSMATVRNVEVLVALRYLRTLKRGGRFTAIGLMGHSGGGSMASLLAWYADDLDAVATDHPSFFFDIGLPEDPEGPAVQVLDETHPGLALLALGIRDLGQAPVPVHVATYGYGLDPGFPAPTTYPEFFAGLLFR